MAPVGWLITSVARTFANANSSRPTTRRRIDDRCLHRERMLSKTRDAWPGFRGRFSGNQDACRLALGAPRSLPWQTSTIRSGLRPIAILLEPEIIRTDSRAFRHRPPLVTHRYLIVKAPSTAALPPAGARVWPNETRNRALNGARIALWPERRVLVGRGAFVDEEGCTRRCRRCGGDCDRCRGCDSGWPCAARNSGWYMPSTSRSEGGRGSCALGTLATRLRSPSCSAAAHWSS